MQKVKDSALILKEKVQCGEKLSNHEITQYLSNSTLIKRLFSRPKWGPEKFVGLRTYEWRLLELSEIPFTNNLNKVQEWLEILIKKKKKKWETKQSQ